MPGSYQKTDMQVAQGLYPPANGIDRNPDILGEVAVNQLVRGPAVQNVDEHFQLIDMLDLCEIPDLLSGELLQSMRMPTVAESFITF